MALFGGDASLLDDDVDFSTIPATALNITSRMILSKFLNPEMQLMSSANYARDFRGLAEQMDFDYMDIKNFQCKSDPTAAVLDSWVRRPNVTIKDLLDMLKNMDRYDAIEDALQQFKNDANSYQRRKRSMNENPIQPIQVPEVTSCRTFESMFNITDAPKELTIDDLQSGGVTQYDAYVCYADEDLFFVHKLAEYLESPGVNLKLCIKGRDILLGNIEFDAYIRLIENRCKVLLLILTPEFLSSKECEFQMNYAAGLAVEQRQRKLIPIVLRPCEIPLILKFLTKLDFTRAAIHEWLWNKLVASIRGVQATFYVASPSGSSALSITGSSSSSSPALPSSSRSPPMLSGSSQSLAMLSYASAAHSCFPGSSQFLPVGHTPSVLMGNSPPLPGNGPLSTSPQPVITFPPTQSYHPVSPEIFPPSVAPAVCGPVTLSATAVPAPSQTLTSPPLSTSLKHTPPVKQKWYRNIKGRFSLTSSTSTSSAASSGTSGFHSQSGTTLESSEVPDNETSM